MGAEKDVELEEDEYGRWSTCMSTSGSVVFFEISLLRSLSCAGVDFGRGGGVIGISGTRSLSRGDVEAPE
jgi:hypothetical protein